MKQCTLVNFKTFDLNKRQLSKVSIFIKVRPFPKNQDLVAKNGKMNQIRFFIYFWRSVICSLASKELFELYQKYHLKVYTTISLFLCWKMLRMFLWARSALQVFIDLYQNLELLYYRAEEWYFKNDSILWLLSASLALIILSHLPALSFTWYFKQ